MPGYPQVLLTVISEIGVRASLRSKNPKNAEIPGVRTRFEPGLLGRSNLYVDSIATTVLFGASHVTWLSASRILPLCH